VKQTTKKILCCITLFLAGFFSVSLSARKIDKQAFASDMAKVYLEEWVALLAHEGLGHALSAKLTDGNPVNIHLGRANLFTLGSEPITIHSPLPVGGWTRIKPTSRPKLFFTSIAGPIAGALAYFFMNLIRNKSRHKEWDKKKLLKKSAASYNVISHLIANLTPYGVGRERSDGAHALKAIFPKATLFDNENFSFVMETAVLVGLSTLPEILELSNEERILIGHKLCLTYISQLLALIKQLIFEKKRKFSGIDIIKGTMLFVMGGIFFFRDYPQLIKAVYGNGISRNHD